MNLIDRLKLHQQHSDGLPVCQIVLPTLDEIIAALSSIPVWVKVSERLPAEDGAYMTFDGEDVGECLYLKAKGFRWMTGLAASVEYWSELPAPPKEV